MNKELMIKTMDYIKANPDEWNQSSYICSTTMCFAGTALMLAGYQTKYILGGRYFVAADSPGLKARDLLGLSQKQSHDIFHNLTTDVQTLENIVKSVMEEAECDRT